MKHLLLILATVFLTACNTLEKPYEEGFDKEENVSAVAAEYAVAFENASPLQLFFKEDQTKAYFLKDGTSGTSFTEKTIWLSKDYVKTIVEKENEVFYSIYRITKDSIELIYEGPTEQSFTLDNLQQIKAKSIFLTLPLETGSMSEGWQVTGNHQRLETPFDTFYDVIEITKEEEERTVRKYFAPGFGLVKETYSIASGEGTFETSFVLERLEY